MEWDSTSSTLCSLRDFKFAAGRSEEVEYLIISAVFSTLPLVLQF